LLRGVAEPGAQLSERENQAESGVNNS
jgi:hypothetical protein